MIAWELMGKETDSGRIIIKFRLNVYVYMDIIINDNKRIALLIDDMKIN